MRLCQVISFVLVTTTGVVVLQMNRISQVLLSLPMKLNPDDAGDTRTNYSSGIYTQSNASQQQTSATRSPAHNPPPSTNITLEDNRKPTALVGGEGTSPTCKQRVTTTVRFKDGDMRLCHLIPYGKNFGDELGPAMVDKLLFKHFKKQAPTCSETTTEGVKVAKLPNRFNCLINLGSILHFLKPNDHVWATGANPHWQKKKRIPSNVTVYATRGPKTAEIIIQHQLKKSNLILPGSAPTTTTIATTPSDFTIPYGDPGLLTALLYPEFRKERPVDTGGQVAGKTKFCFVPHVQDMGRPEVKTLEEAGDIDIISPHDHWQPVVERLSRCDYVASTSLHGIIIADSFGIPSQWVQFKGSKTEKTEGHFKYMDYFLSVDKPDAKPVNGVASIRDTENSYMEPMSHARLTKYMDAMVQSFPYHLFEITSTAQSE